MMAVEERRAGVEYVQRHVPQLEVVWDQHRNGNETYQRALTHIGFDAAVFLEDDVILTRDFTTKIETAISEHPNRPIQFFSRRQDDLTVGSRLLPGKSYLMNQCHYLPAGFAAKILKLWLTTNPKPERWLPAQMDVITADAIDKHYKHYWNHVPSLVEHAEITSTVDPHRSTRRQSLTFQDPETDHCPHTVPERTNTQ